jgi:hypothetical protein
MKLFRMKKHALVSLMFLGTLMVLLASVGNVNATTTELVKEHHPSSTMRDPTGTIDAYFIGQTITFHIHLNVTSSTAPFPWLSISNLTIIDILPNLGGGGPLYMTYVSGSQASSSAAGAAAFTDFGNGTLRWNFGAGPFTTGVTAPPPFGTAGEYWTASITFNAIFNINVVGNTYLTNTGVATYTETVSQVHSAPSVSDVIWTTYSPSSPPTVGGTDIGINAFVVLRPYIGFGIVTAVLAITVFTVRKRRKE